MVTILDDGDRINISMTDARILVALLAGPMSGYEIARQCEKDGEKGDRHRQRVSNGLIYRSIKKLIECHLIEVAEVNDAPRRPGAKTSVYRITDVGRWLS
jgi:DNA-binding PadR family transcriptional regulator